MIHPKRWSRRAWLRTTTYSTAAGLFAYANQIERKNLVVEKQVCPISSAFSDLNGLRIGLMADFHFDDWGHEETLMSAVDNLNRENVDLVMLAGDYVSRDPSYLQPLAEILSQLRPRIGVFGCMGNHDHRYSPALLRRTMQKYGIRIYANECVELENLALLFPDSAMYGATNVSQELQSIPRDKPAIVCWHEPDTFDFYDDARVVLQVSGHSHGGQVCAPWYGPVVLPPLAQKYQAGHFQKATRNLYVTRGFGTLTLPVRFLSPPELTILTLDSHG